jgi:putative DNA primase/helicase
MSTALSLARSAVTLDSAMPQHLRARCSVLVAEMIEDSSFVRTASAVGKESRPAFPVRVLPGVTRQLVEQGVASLQAPPDLIAVPLLTFAAAVMGNSQRIQLKEGWSEFPILYTAVVARPGSAKTAAQKIAKHGIDRLQRASDELFTQEREAYKDGGEIGLPPTYSHLYTTDATIEALAPMAASSPGLVAIFDELMGWMNGQNAYRGGKGSDRQKWLSGWSGDDLKIDRKGADVPILVKDPVICVTGGIQPDVLPQLRSNGSEEGTDGFLERILWSWPAESWPSWSDDVVPATTQDAVARVFKALRDQKPGPPVRMSSEAKILWISWYDEHRDRMALSRGILQTMQAKMPVHLARLALVLHCLTHPSSPSSVEISHQTMQDAIDLTAYFQGHAIVVLGTQPVGGSSTDGLPARILSIMQDRDCEPVSKSDISKALGHNQKAAAIDSALITLGAAGLAEMSMAQTGGRPAETWRCTGYERTN